MKYLYLTLCLFACLSAQAYNDHRNARIDSLEAALKSNHPPKGDDLLRAYDELMRGWLPYYILRLWHGSCRPRGEMPHCDAPTGWA